MVREFFVLFVLMLDVLFEVDFLFVIDLLWLFMLCG